MTSGVDRLSERTASRRSRVGWWARPDFAVPAVLLAPSIVLLLVVIALPMVQAIQYSMTDGSLLKPGDFIGFDNYIELAKSRAFWNSLRFSLIFAVGNIVGCYVLGLGLALLLQQDFPFRGVIRVLLLLPWIVPSLVAVASWRFMLDDRDAFFNQLIMMFGGDPIYFLTHNDWTIAVVVVIKIWRSFPFMMLSLLAALQSIDRSLYEAAEVDGATKWQAFWYITMPQIANISIVLCLLMTIWTVNDFDTPWLLSQGGPAQATENLVVLAYRFTFAKNDVGAGSAISLTTLIILMAIFLVILRLRKT